MTSRQIKELARERREAELAQRRRLKWTLALAVVWLVLSVAMGVSKVRRGPTPQLPGDRQQGWPTASGGSNDLPGAAVLTGQAPSSYAEDSTRK